MLFVNNADVNVMVVGVVVDAAVCYHVLFLFDVTCCLMCVVCCC